MRMSMDRFKGKPHMIFMGKWMVSCRFSLQSMRGLMCVGHLSWIAVTCQARDQPEARFVARTHPGWETISAKTEGDTHKTSTNFMKPNIEWTNAKKNTIGWTKQIIAVLLIWIGHESTEKKEHTNPDQRQNKSQLAQEPKEEPLRPNKDARL